MTKNEAIEVIKIMGNGYSLEAEDVCKIIEMIDCTIPKSSEGKKK